ncbi:hypothetical protein AB0J72_28500 [Dactylosporangium sp. NPDC049742]|uniref:hypothetical protein n=1 Tax=Dactylosporangium sp. NPDC049742 TaxID=3154737 RepID=UPI00342A4D16
MKISLTGPDSHRLERRPGVGVVVIGPEGGTPRPDLVVAPGDAIDWSVFDPFTVPAGYPWPRRIVYDGDDTGFFRWAGRRPIETFDWRPRAAHAVDAAAADIGTLGITLRDAPLRLTLPAARGHVMVTGDPHLLVPDLAPGAACPGLSFAPDTRPGPGRPPLRLPDLPALAGAHSVRVTVPPLRQPFDCASLLQFPELRTLTLSGGLANVDALGGLRRLTALHLQLCPDLTGLPAVDAWPDLTRLFASDVDAVVGKRLRGHGTVTRLRRPEWFAAGHGLPFAGWPSRTGKAATAAYRAAEQAIGAATTRQDVEAAVRGFVGAVNALPGIETTEREDAGEAVHRLTATTPCGDLTEAAARWFDEVRDF